MSVVTASDEMPICVKRFGSQFRPPIYSSHPATQTTQFVLVKSSHRFRLTMAANDIADVLRNPDATRAAVEEFYNFLQTFRVLGAGGSVTVIYVYIRMRETGLPTGYIGPCMENTDPTTTAPTGKTNFDYIIYLTFHGCYQQT